MTTAQLNPATSLPAEPITAPTRKQWTRQEYEQLLDSGILDNKRVERISGELIDMPSMKDRHAFALKAANLAISKIYSSDRTTIQVQCPMRIGEWNDPEPDLAVISGGIDQQQNHPTTALVVVEVADTSLRYDRSIKAALYAEARVTTYLIVNLIDNCSEAHMRPGPEASGTFRYFEMRRFERGQTIELPEASAALAVSDIIR